MLDLSSYQTLKVGKANNKSTMTPPIMGLYSYTDGASSICEITLVVYLMSRRCSAVRNRQKIIF